MPEELPVPGIALPYSTPSGSHLTKSTTNLGNGHEEPRLLPPHSHLLLQLEPPSEIQGFGTTKSNEIISLSTFDDSRKGTKGGGFNVMALPADILSEIFQKFVEDDPTVPKAQDSPRPLVSPSCSSDPTILGQICSRWRMEALSFPKLWSKIDIYNPKPSQIYLTSHWIQRSGNTPLTLRIRSRDFCDSRAAKAILNMFISRLEYWGKVDFEMPLELLGPFYEVVRGPKKPLLLESVKFWFCNTARHQYEKIAGPYVNSLWKFFYTSPALRQVYWGGEDVNRFPRRAPFQQLTHVQANFTVSVHDVLAFLSHTPLIQNFSITTIDIPSKPTFKIISPPLLLEHLVTLLVRSRYVEISSLFSSVTCPHLESLTVSNGIPLPGDQYLSEIAQFFWRSHCRLKKLEHRCIIAPEHILEEYLSSPALQSLTSLDIWLQEESFRDRIVQLLTETTGGHSHRWLPVLEKLFLGPCKTTDGLLTKMVSSRWSSNLDEYSTPQPGRLRRVVVNPWPVYGPTDEMFFTKLRALNPVY